MKGTESTKSEEISDENFTCHQDYENYMTYVLGLKFWLECVLLSIIGACGLLGNIVTFVVLKGQVRQINLCIFIF